MISSRTGLFFQPQHVHFVGIGGIGMSGLAEILLTLGYQVSGSDLRGSATTQRLEKLGAQCFEGHAASHIDGAKVVVITSAVNETNPEVAEARRRQVPVIPRGELLAELMRLKFGIAIAGSHGKTTTTSMVATILNHADMDPTVVVGGRVNTMGGNNARLGHSDFLVVESDESDGSFLKLAPILAVVTNIDREHLDHYASLDEIRQAFAEFVNKVPFYGAAVLCLDDENIQGILPRVNRRTITYGTTAQADLQIAESHCTHLASTFRLRFQERDLGQFQIEVPGFHNVLNATAAVGIALELGIAPERIVSALAQYSGVDRRFQIRGHLQGITVIDDYGHHPTEIRATLAAARDCNYGRIHAIFQPHRYSRTMHLMDDFAKSLLQADSVQVLDIYAASEAPIEGVTAEVLVERARSFGHRSIEYAPSLVAAAAAARKQARAGDAVITLGAGNVWQAGDILLASLSQETDSGT